jgi:hypothetical protein
MRWDDHAIVRIGLPLFHRCEPRTAAGLDGHWGLCGIVRLSLSLLERCKALLSGAYADRRGDRRDDDGCTVRQTEDDGSINQ